MATRVLQPAHLMVVRPEPVDGEAGLVIQRPSALRAAP
jgi:hypothetical protein